MGGLKRLLRFDAGFVQWFDRSPQGARRSFGLMIPTFPLFLVLNFAGVSLAPDVEMFRVVAVTVIAFVLSWVMFPLILILIGRTIDRESQAIGALTSYNWFNFSLSAIGCVFSLIVNTGIFGQSAGLVVSVFIVVYLAYETFLLRVALGIGYGGAILLSIVDFALGKSLYILLMSPIMATTAS